MDISAKVKARNECLHGQHVFITSTWKKSKDKETCIRFTCQHCLIAVDRQETEECNQKQHEAIKKATKQDA